jgi:hypothetical protein
MNLPLPSLSRSSTSLVGNRLLAALTLGIAAAAVVPTVEAGVVTINLTNTRNDGTTTTDDTIGGPNAGLSTGGYLPLTNWLGLGVGDLGIANRAFAGTTSDWSLWLLNGAEFSFANNGGDPALLSPGNVIDASDFTVAYVSPLTFRAESGPSTVTYNRPAFSPNTYLGFRISAGANDYRYGYLGVSWDGNGTFQITSGAYEATAGLAITIPSGGGGGGGSSVPDSSSTGLMGLLFAGAAVRQWRKSRR